MAFKKSSLHSSLWVSCDQLRSDIDAELPTRKAKLTKARQLKQSIMQQLLTSKTRQI